MRVLFFFVLAICAVHARLGQQVLNAKQQNSVIGIDKILGYASDKPLSQAEQATYAAHIGLTKSHISHGANMVPSKRDLDKSRAKQLEMSNQQATNRVANQAAKPQGKQGKQGKKNK